MNRRKFLITLGDTALLLVLPALVECSSASNSANGLTVTSGTAGTDNHTHQFTIPAGTLSAPPANGFQNQTTVSDAHTHVVILSAANLTNINAGQTVLVNTSQSNVDGHFHQFSFHT